MHWRVYYQLPVVRGKETKTRGFRPFFVATRVVGRSARPSYVISATFRCTQHPNVAPHDDDDALKRFAAQRLAQDSTAIWLRLAVRFHHTHCNALRVHVIQFGLSLCAANHKVELSSPSKGLRVFGDVLTSSQGDSLSTCVTSIAGNRGYHIKLQRPGFGLALPFNFSHRCLSAASK